MSLIGVKSPASATAASRNASMPSPAPTSAASAAAARFGVEDAFDPAQNIAGGVAYLDWLLEEFERDPILALAGYNAGEGAVRNAGGVPDFAETRDYVPRVLATWASARLLCLTPPELVSDGCVFRTMVAN